MGLKDYLGSIFNINEDEFENDTFPTEAESTEAEAEKVSKREPIMKKYSFERKNQAPEGTPSMRMVLVRPEIFSDVAAIADHLKQGKTIVLNLENAESAQARRIVDFLSGAAYAISFKFKPVSNSTFVIIPDNTDFSGDILFDDYGSENYFL